MNQNFSNRSIMVQADDFRIEDLSLPRPAEGYAVQYLGRDVILDRVSGAFLPIRHPRLDGLFASFEEARQAALDWAQRQDNPPANAAPLAIVPAAFDPVSERHILIYGVLMPEPTADETAVYIAPHDG